MNKLDPTKRNEMFTFGFREGNSIRSPGKRPRDIMQSNAQQSPEMNKHITGTSTVGYYF